MLDLSNNNGAVDFRRVYEAGQRRVYLKNSEGKSFADPDATSYFHRAQTAHMKVGFYHFARPSKNSAKEEAIFFLRTLPVGWLKRNGTTLRPCLDLEDPEAPPSKLISDWALEWLLYVKNHAGIYPIVYGSPWYLENCHFSKPWVSLWLASYGRNDGKEYPFRPPPPWTMRQTAAHQYSSEARVAGVAGKVDISHVLKRSLLDVRRWSR